MLDFLEPSGQKVLGHRHLPVGVCLPCGSRVWVSGAAPRKGTNGTVVKERQWGRGTLGSHHCGDPMQMLVQ